MKALTRHSRNQIIIVIVIVIVIDCPGKDYDYDYDYDYERTFQLLLPERGLRLRTNPYQYSIASTCKSAKIVSQTCQIFCWNMRR